MKLTRFFLAVVLTAAAVPVPEVIAAPGVQPWNRPCIRFYDAWKKKPKHKAFAVVNSNSGQGCGGSWGAPSVKAAIESAKKWCKKASEDGARCRVTASE